MSKDVLRESLSLLIHNFTNRNKFFLPNKVTRFLQLINLQKILLVLVDNLHNESSDNQNPPDSLSHPTNLIQFQLQQSIIDPYYQTYHSLVEKTLTYQTDMISFLKNSQNLCLSFHQFLLHIHMSHTQSFSNSHVIVFYLTVDSCEDCYCYVPHQRFYIFCCVCYLLDQMQFFLISFGQKTGYVSSYLFLSWRLVPLKCNSSHPQFLLNQRMLTLVDLCRQYFRHRS